MGWEPLVFPVVEQDAMVLATAFPFWRKKSGDTVARIGTVFQSTFSDKGQICAFKLHTGPDFNIYTECFASSNLLPGLLHRMSITAQGSSIIS